VFGDLPGGAGKLAVADLGQVLPSGSGAGVRRVQLRLLVQPRRNDPRRQLSGARRTQCSLAVASGVGQERPKGARSVQLSGFSTPPADLQRPVTRNRPPGKAQSAVVLRPKRPTSW
jgi:hypothetical protein